ncbi:uncharacterized protein N7511_003418 [Penicillium nucicola]|uniref:uncharacterized protein n=1 Tax=Penicillium nucicola TaxID=1850975 RepID=UPI002545281F|nr:uncharacterized protein N7511_003418 [Penicillium nucicola]KAJ5771367.1 hypothetical protein N7511_003418 [Penicillium nucicola]
MSEYPHKVALLGLGTIGLSMLAMHLRRPDTSITVYDPRPDTEAQIRSNLPSLLESRESSPSNSGLDTDIVDDLFRSSRLKLARTLQEALTNATIIQEQSPEITSSKQALWKEVGSIATRDAHLWSSSSGIAASAQNSTCEPADGVGERLLVAHPFNPPHIMPLVEVVPGPETAGERIEFVKWYFRGIPGPGFSSGSADAQAGTHYRPVTLHKEVPGFVGNRLAFALLREACSLVGEGVVSARDLDAIVMASVGPRWAGSVIMRVEGEGGIGAFLQKLEPTIQDVWEDLAKIDIHGDQAWRDRVVQQTEEAYGPLTAESRKTKEQTLKGVLEVQKRQGAS